MITIRPMAHADLVRVFEMVKALAAYHGRAAETTFDTLQRDTTGAHPWLRVLVAEAAADVVGYAALRPMAKLQTGLRTLDVHHLFVDEAWRGQGVGQALLDAGADLARELGCKELTIGTHPKNTRAQGIYEAYGFTRVEQPDPQFRLPLE